MRVVIATDAWRPQVNGVVRTLEMTVAGLAQSGFEVTVVEPSQFRTIACPGYSEIRLALAPRLGVRRKLAHLRPDIVHISTEGPIGWAARSWCKANGVAFTSAFHTRFPDYASVRTGLSPDFFWPLMRRFHAPSRAVLAATPGLMDELRERGIANTRLWSRGIDTSLFKPEGARHPKFAELQGPIMLSVGRVAIEKNLEAFLRTEHAGSKVVVGDGPALDQLRAQYPDTLFMGALSGEELAAAYRSADIFVFPSCSDTFGLVMIEALACGTPVAAFPVAGPRDVLTEAVGATDMSLGKAIARALRIDRRAAAAYGATFSWDRATSQFAAALTEAARREEQMRAA